MFDQGFTSLTYQSILKKENCQSIPRIFPEIAEKAYKSLITPIMKRFHRFGIH